MVLIVLIVIGSITTILVVARSPYRTAQHEVVEQPVPFSHQHHVNDIGIDCRYCHRAVTESSTAGVPSTEVCMTCHRELWKDSPMLEPVRQSWAKNEPLEWVRVHDLPDYVYFNHSIHIKKGIGCYECHGNVAEMPLTKQVQPLTMKWCLDCHRHPTDHLRPRDLVFQPHALTQLTNRAEYQQAVADAQIAESSATAQTLDALREHLAEEYDIKSRTDCYTCHR